MALASEGELKIKFWGVRGSIPSPGGFTAKIGGNTSCVEVRAGGQLLIFDMGTGARALGGSLMAAQPVKAHVFFSHLHHDHTQGIPFFAPCFIPSSELTFYSVDMGGDSPQSLLYRLFDHPYFPVPLKGMPSHKDFVVLSEGGVTDLGPDLKVFNRKLNHPDGVLGFRVEAVESGVKKVFTFCTDTEHSTESDANVKALADQSDVFVFDAQYTDEEYPSKVGWGHSTVSEAAKLAIASGSKRLLLFHHDPTHNDEKVLAMEASAQGLFKNSQAAAEGLEIEI
jgi:phosphoribosyl 1,2-cyclic phosphodiesterase